MHERVHSESNILRNKELAPNCNANLGQQIWDHIQFSNDSFVGQPFGRSLPILAVS